VYSEAVDFARTLVCAHRFAVGMGLATISDANLALARKVFSLFQTEDFGAVVPLLHEDVEARPSLDGAPVLRGREAVEGWWNQFASVDAEFEVRPLEFEPRGDCVIVRGYLRHRSGRTLAESQVFWLYEIHDGVITRMESHPTRASAIASV
jgi:ketosteroid isomerase-like protein